MNFSLELMQGDLEKSFDISKAGTIAIKGFHINKEGIKRKPSDVSMVELESPLCMMMIVF